MIELIYEIWNLKILKKELFILALLDLLFDMYPMFKEKYEAEFGEKETTNQEKETTIDEKDITIKSLSNE